MSSLREQILATETGCATEAVMVPAWGQTVHVKELSASDQDALEMSFSDERDKAKEEGKAYKPNVRAKTIVACVCDATGQPIFQAIDEAMIGNMAVHKLEGLLTVIDRLNRLSESHKKKLEKKYEVAGDTEPASGSPGSGESKTL